MLCLFAADCALVAFFAFGINPCCGGGYLLTVLGFLNYERIKTIMASDISDDAIQLANENLSLLDKNGLKKRIRQINDLLSLTRIGK